MRLNNSNPNSRKIKTPEGIFPTQKSVLKKYSLNYTEFKQKIKENIFCYLDEHLYKRKLKLKYKTPFGSFSTKKEIIKIVKIPEWTVATIFDNLDSLPISNRRGSKRITHLNLDYSKSWRENGFSLINDYQDVEN